MADDYLSREDPDPARALALVGAVASRICHDLVSPVGAVVNGVDLMREIGSGGADEEAAMIGASASRASALLEWHRMAFGVVSHGAAGVQRRRFAAMAGDVLSSRRISVSVTPPEGPDLSRAVARLASLMLLSGRALMGMRGSLSLALPANGVFPLHLAVDGMQAEGPATLAARTGAPAPAPEARSVEFDLLLPAASAAGARLRVGLDGNPLLIAEPA